MLLAPFTHDNARREATMDLAEKWAKKILESNVEVLSYIILDSESKPQKSRNCAALRLKSV